MVLNFIPRKPKKTIALALIVTGLLFATPPLVPLTAWTEILLNAPLAKFILENTFVTSRVFAFFLTFTLVPILLIWGGAILYPHDTNSVLHGIRNRIVDGVRRYINLVKREPLYILLLIGSLYLVYWFYTNNLLI